MLERELQEEIIRLKEEKDFCILAHAYQNHSILEVADYTGDSFGLSVEASKVPQKNIIMCGVKFMAETCKILSPGKNVYLANPHAGCPMADQLDLAGLEKLKEQHPGYTPVAYINTTSEMKSGCEVCVTSSSAVEICAKLENDKILFVPDPNLGRFVAEKLPDKEFAFFDGGCPHHKKMSAADVYAAKEAHPNALLLVHPECPQEVSSKADYVGSTTGIMKYARESEAEEFIIGTEISIAEHMQYECPDKKFYPLSLQLCCPDMRATTLMDIYNCMKGEGGLVIEMEASTLEGAGRCINNMIELG